MSNLIRVMIVDDHPLMRKGIQQLLSIDPKFHVVAEATNGIEAVSYAKKLHPDLILLDYNMHGISGLATLKAFKKDNCLAKVIIFTVNDNKQDVISMINQGADGYLLKDSPPALLLENINTVLLGKLVITDKLSGFLNELDDNNNIREKLANLTNREQQMITEVAKGFNNKKIAENLQISEGTVKVHIKSLLKKLDLKSRVEVAVLYLQQPK